METLSPRRSLLIVLAGLVLQGGVATQSIAQDKFVGGGELPMMALRICKSLEGAQRQAKISKELGFLSLEDAKTIPLKEPHCRLVMVSARPFQVEDIPPYVSWAAIYDRSSPTTINQTVGGQTYSVNYSYQRQLMRFYTAAMTDAEGNRFDGWVEIPERPYMVGFLEAKRLFPNN